MHKIIRQHTQIDNNLSLIHISIGVGEDRLRERGSLPATFYVLKGYFLWQTIRAANSNRIK